MANEAAVEGGFDRLHGATGQALEVFASGGEAVLDLAEANLVEVIERGLAEDFDFLWGDFACHGLDD